MKKLRLDLDAVAVETFRVEPGFPAARGGTIAAFVDTANSCGIDTCNINTLCVCYPVYETVSCGQCEGSAEIWSCAYTECDNCVQSQNEASTCYLAFSCSPAHC